MVFRLLLLCIWLVPSWAFAVCATPAGDAGHVIFNTTTKTMQYCNGSNWVNTGKSEPAATQAGCTSPTGVAGEVIYASTTGVIQFCNGQNWVDTACAAQRFPNGSGCDGKPAGTLQYSITHNELQYCDSTDWVAMGWGCPSDLSVPVWVGPTTYSYTAMQGQPFGFTPTVTDDMPGVTFRLLGTLPTGMAFNSSTGAISGSPSVLGNYTFKLRATDTSANFVEQEFTVEVVPAEVVVTIAANANNVNLQSLFDAGDWASAVKTKRVIINTGVTVGSTSAATAALLTGTGRGKDLIIENRGTVAGAGGAVNGGAGGAAINSQQSGVSIINTGNIYGGGGGGGRGGNGGAGSYNVVTNNGWQQSYNEWHWSARKPDIFEIFWNGAVIVRTTYSSVGAISSYTTGGYTYTRYASNGDGTRFAISRYYTTGTTGGAGGNGGRGQGSDGAATAGAGGAAGGTNAGTGGKGGNGGGYGAAGAAGATGGSGNAGGGAAGSAGGAAGRAVAGSGYTVTNTGSILGAY